MKHHSKFMYTTFSYGTRTDS